MYPPKKTLSLLGALALVALFAAPAEATGSDDARVRVVHASPDAPNVDVLADGAPVFQNAPFKGITDYAAVPANVYNVQVVAAGTGGPAVIDADLNLFYGTTYTVVATNFLADIAPLVLEDSQAFVSFRDASVRFVHASPDAPNVDIKVVDGPFLFQDVPFQGVGDYVTIPKGTYDLEVRVAGTDTVALTIPGVNFRRASTNTIFAVGTLADGTLGVIASEDRRGFGFFGFESPESGAEPEQIDASAGFEPYVQKNELRIR